MNNTNKHMLPDEVVALLNHLQEVIGDRFDAEVDPGMWAAVQVMCPVPYTPADTRDDPNVLMSLSDCDKFRWDGELFTFRAHYHNCDGVFLVSDDRLCTTNSFVHIRNIRDGHEYGYALMSREEMRDILLSGRYEIK